MAEAGRGQDPGAQGPSKYDSHFHLVSFILTHKHWQICNAISPKHLNIISFVHTQYMIPASPIFKILPIL